jgi:hypothetical protein
MHCVLLVVVLGRQALLHLLLLLLFVRPPPSLAHVTFCQRQRQAESLLLQQPKH